MASSSSSRRALWLSFAGLAVGQNCYYGPGLPFQVPSDVNLVPCVDSGFSTCCFEGDICLSGNACYNAQTRNTYQYGCTDESYQDESCPFKCGFSPNHSPWVALQRCEAQGLPDTWVCTSPESCGCEWRSTYQLLELPIRACDAMGSFARVAIKGATALAAYASLPPKVGGKTGFYSGSMTTVDPGYTPKTIGPTASYDMPMTVLQLYPNSKPSPSFGTATLPNGSLPPLPTTGALAVQSSYPPELLRGSTSGIKTGGGSSPSGGSGGGGGSSSGDNGGGSSSSGLSTGAKVGIGVGIAGGVCLIAALVLTAFVLRKRKQMQSSTKADMDSGDNTYNDKTHSYQSYTSVPTNSTAHNSYNPHLSGFSEPMYTPLEEEMARKRMTPLGAQELDADSEVHEMESQAGMNEIDSTVGTPRLSPAVAAHSRSVSDENN